MSTRNTIRRSLAAAALALTLGTLAARTAEGQGNCTGTGTTSNVRTCSVNITPNSPIVLPKLGRLSVTATALQNLSNPSYAAFDAGFVLDSMAYTASANAPWSLRIAATAGTFWQVFANDPTYGGFVPAWTTKPIAEGQVSVSSSSGFLGVPSAPTAFVSGLAAGRDLTGWIYWRTLYDYSSDTPGTYRMPVAISIIVP